ncbi:Polyadenylate-binding protein-interacting protein 9 [Hibiscus syriacus]|uniref:Polyadenylate-binding protein-interacting protein 9 n=1 Tax=Hibiscus syriacus TaxID=106335 RepID=A0A6A2Y7U8_HIBSY|nr:polyadenylate-binding protein-interacting protein 9-like [Hibiscus syriacus]KAE8677785.1 Polyadenylate-binding protein-interacting protein 9 [Hibiscus syriacus]
MAAVANGNSNLVVETSKSESKDFNVQKIVDMFTKLNPLAKEFFPSSYHHNPTKTGDFNQVPANKQGNYSNRRGRNNNQGKRKLNGKAFQAQAQAQRDDSIRRTVYVSDIDQSTTEEQLAGLFSNCGQIVDCRVCGDPNSVLHFAFVEFADEEGARVALNLDGTVLGFYPVKVLPSKTAILPVNPTFLPKSKYEREMCTRTVYCTNIDKEVSQAEVKNFFESSCGEVTRWRILGDNVHSTCIAFVEFAMAESAVVALSCSGLVLGTQPIRVSPSKTPVRPRVTRPTSG